MNDARSVRTEHPEQHQHPRGRESHCRFRLDDLVSKFCLDCVAFLEMSRFTLSVGMVQVPGP